jgi:hypothetical protein
MKTSMLSRQAQKIIKKTIKELGELKYGQIHVVVKVNTDDLPKVVRFSEDQTTGEMDVEVFHNEGEFRFLNLDAFNCHREGFDPKSRANRKTFVESMFSYDIKTGHLKERDLIPESIKSRVHRIGV